MVLVTQDQSSQQNLFCGADPLRASSKSRAFSSNSKCITVCYKLSVPWRELLCQNCVFSPSFCQKYTHTSAPVVLFSAAVDLNLAFGGEGLVHWLQEIKCQHHAWQLGFSSCPLAFLQLASVLKNLRLCPVITFEYNAQKQVSDSSIAVIKLHCRQSQIPISASTNNNFIAIWDLQWKGPAGAYRKKPLWGVWKC